MSFSRPLGRLHPKISTMPRQQSESSHYLNIYKLTIEKRRLRQELQSLDKRRDRLESRLEVLEREIEALDDQAHHLRQPSTSQPSLSEPNSIVYPPAMPGSAQDADDFKTLMLDY